MKRGRQPIPHVSVNGVESKLCGRCKQHFPLANFNRSTRSWDGLLSQCRPCSRTMSREARIRTKARPKKFRAFKRCPRCETVKPASEYTKQVGKHDGLNAWCKPCARAYAIALGRTDKVRTSRTLWAATKGREAVKRYVSRYPAKKHAQMLLTRAIAEGEIVNPRVCSECRRTERVEGHHDDYAEPYTVRWLCRWCHRAWHRENGEGLNADMPVPVGKRHEQRERRRARHSLIPNMLAGGMKQKAIAAALGVTQATICQDIKFLGRE